MRERLWPGAAPHLWDRKSNKGFTTIPKTFPMILKIMDEMTNGAPVSATYQALWCSTWDNSYVSLGKNSYLPYASGFSGQRAHHTWATRMKKLHELRFIDIQSGKHGDMSNVIIWNPHLVIRWHRQQETSGLLEASYNTLVEWAIDIGAKDMTEDMNPVPEPGVVPPEAKASTVKKKAPARRLKPIKKAAKA